MTESRLDVYVLLLFGDEAHLRTPERDADDPEIVPVDRIIRDTGLAREEVAGARLVAVVRDGELVRFELPPA